MTRTTIRSEDITAGQVKSADLASDAVDTTSLETDIALLGFKVAANGSLAAYNLKDQTVDAFEDASGIDASASTDETRNASNYYSGTSTAAGNATGGTITTSGGNTIHTFNTAGNGSSTNDFVTPSSGSVDYLVVAGGGSGGSGYGGGGGGGGMLTGSSFAVTAQTYAITSGAGGAAGSYAGVGASGANSTFSSVTATGGGRGAARPTTTSGATGGSGGGGTDGGTGSSGTSGQGNAGANGAGNYGGGGGGAGGAASYNGSGPGAGGSGLASSITGASVTYAGGGGGGSASGSVNGASGGSGGGGAGGKGTDPANSDPGPTGSLGADGTDGLGGGGGGGGYAKGGDGGNGVVVIAYTTNSFTVTNYEDMTLISNASTADSAPTTGDIVMTYTNGSGTATVNTDLKAYISRDNGSTWTQATLTSEGTTGGHSILTAHNVDISSQPSGTSMRYKIETLNQGSSKETRIQAVSLGWS